MPPPAPASGFWNWLMSKPAQKLPPWPVSTTALTPGSAWARCSAANSERRTAQRGGGRGGWLVRLKGHRSWVAMGQGWVRGGAVGDAVLQAVPAGGLLAKPHGHKDGVRLGGCNALCAVVLDRV